MATGCTFGAECRLFETRLAELPGLAAMFQERYCAADFHRCVRYQLATECGHDSVPDALMPNNHEWANELTLVAFR